MTSRDAPNLPKGPAQQPALRLPLGLTLLMLGLSWLPRVRENPDLTWSFWGFGAGLLLWQLALLWRSVRTGRRLHFQLVVRQTHYVQAAVQLCLFAYWGWYWRNVYHEFALIFAQLIFAYVFDMLLCWSRRDRWQLGFSPFPIVFSTNLFLWFKDDWFFLQFLMVAIGFLGKEFCKWTKDGRRTHIFNPSALSLFVLSVALIATGRTDITWGEEISTTLGNPDHIYLQIFLLGFVVQYLFSVTLMTLFAVVALYVLNLVYTSFTGVYYFFDSGIPIAVFLGLHLLITDPSTSPRTHLGRLMFGALYGSGVFALYGILEVMGAPRFYDKLLCVPLLNVGVQVLDRIAGWRPLAGLNLKGPGWSLSPRQLNLCYMAVWGALFTGMLTTNFLGKGHEGRDPLFWRQACERDLRNGCENWVFLQTNSCRGGSAAGCNQLGLLLSEGKPVARNPLEAGKSFARGCDLGLVAGCNNLISLVGDDGGKVMSQACHTGDGLSCYILGSLRKSGKGVSRDESRAFDLFRKSCEHDWPRGCGRMAESYLWGEGAEVDYARAAEGFQKACDGQHAESCSNLGLMNRRGKRIPKNERRAQELFRRACELGLPPACTWAEGPAETPGAY